MSKPARISRQFELEAFVASMRQWLAQVASGREARTACQCAIIVSDYVNSKSGRAWPSLHTVARIAGISVDTARRDLDLLVSLGHLERDIEIVSRARTRTLYKPVLKDPTDPKGLPSYRTDAVGGPSKSAPTPPSKSAALEPVEGNLSIQEEPIEPAAGDPESPLPTRALITSHCDSTAAATTREPDRNAAKPIDPGEITPSARGSIGAASREVAVEPTAPGSRPPSPTSKPKGGLSERAPRRQAEPPPLIAMMEAMP